MDKLSDMAQKKRAPSPAADVDRYMLLILGMHRSGTSALGGVLHHLGCVPPINLMPPTEHNPKGHFESETIFHFNDELLKDAGSDWRDWRPLSPDWFASPVGQAYQARAAELLTQEFGDAPLCFLKDPRICRMTPFWRTAGEQAGMTILPVLTHRNPFEVARSLSKRNGIDAPEALAIWLRHILDAEADTRGTPRVFVSYDALLQNWPTQINRIQKNLDIVFPRFDDRTSTQIDEFLSSQLRHFNEPNEKLSENHTLSSWIRETYRIVERWAQKGEVKADHKILDQIRNGFDAAAPLFSQLVGPESHLAKRLDTRINTLLERNTVNEGKLAVLRVAQKEGAVAQAELNQARHTLKKELAARKALHQQLGQAGTEANRLRNQLNERDEELAKQTADHLQLQNDLNSTRTLLEDKTFKLDAMAASIAQREKQIEDQKAARAALHAELASAKSRLEKLEAEIKAANANLAKRDAQMAEQQTSSQSIQAKLDEADNRSKALQADIQAEQAKQDTMAKEHAARTAALRAELLQSTSQAAAQKSAIEDTVHALKATEEKLEKSEAALGELQDKLAQTESALAQRRLETEEAMAASADAEQARLDAEQARLAAEREVERLQQDAQARVVELANFAELLQTSDADFQKRLKDEQKRSGDILKRLNKELSSLQGAQSDSNQLIDEIRARHKSAESELAVVKKAQSKAEMALASSQEALAKKTREFEDLSESHKEHESALGKKAHALQKAEGVIAEQATAVETLTAANEAQTAELSLLVDLLKEAETAAESNAVQIETLEVTRRDHIALIDEKQQQLSQRDTEITSHLTHIAHVDTELAKKHAHIAALEAELAGNHKHISYVDAERITLQERIKELENQVIAIDNSTFWRMTKPLRAIVDAVRRKR